MGICWFCHWGWPKQIADIYQEALAKLDGDNSPLHFGPAHIVWEDENFDSAQWCLDHFDKYKGDYSEAQLAVVKESLVKLLSVPAEYKTEPDGYDDDDENPQRFPPPAHWEMVKNI
jgi:hypothetical protein